MTAAGHEAMVLASALLQRVRLADPLAGFWEAADVQWWWRRPRLSDEVEQVFWVDDQGPVAAAYLTSWGENRWQCDVIVVPGAPPASLEMVWARAEESVRRHVAGDLEMLLRDDDLALRELAESAGFVAGEWSGTAWMDAAERPAVRPMPEGFVLVDRTQRAGAPHPMRVRNGDTVAERLAECPLYDPELDLAVETADGRDAGYALFWFDPRTAVGLVEPVRVEDEFQRRGLATAMVTVGIDRLVAKGAERVKIGFGTEAAAAVYLGLGFRQTSIDTTYERSPKVVD